MRSLSYTALEAIRVEKPQDRIRQIESYARGKLVFDLGALDETAFESKQDTDTWLHARLCAVAREVVGIDNSELVPPVGLQTRPNGKIFKANIFDLAEIVARHGKPDLVVAGELIEHLPDTLEFLQGLKRCRELESAQFVFSTPNACSWHNVIVGLAGRESMHRDHLQIYSYKTLRTLFDRAGIELVSLRPYGARFDEMIDRTSGVKRTAVRCFQAGINLLEFAAPVLSAGWVGVARL